MKTGFDIKQLGLQLRHGLEPAARHHVIITFVFVMGILIYAVFTVNNILTQPADQAYITEKEGEMVKTRFDEATIQRIDALQASQERSSITLPPGRINPFVE